MTTNNITAGQILNTLTESMIWDKAIQHAVSNQCLDTMLLVLKAYRMPCTWEEAEQILAILTLRKAA